MLVAKIIPLWETYRLASLPESTNLPESIKEFAYLDRTKPGSLVMGSRLLTIESLSARCLLAGDATTSMDDSTAVAEVLAQYEIKHPPRLQLGNAPLIGTPDDDGLDQVEIIWQTVTVDEGDEDRFHVEYRPVGQSKWSLATELPKIEIGFASRTMHSALIDGLAWDSDYEYRVQHWRGDAILTSYQHRFHSRLAASDPSAFSFAAYGDSAMRTEHFPSVQRRITAMNLDFAVLLGDNFYTFGSHHEADARFDPQVVPEVLDWNPSKIDYFAIGNHEIFVDEGKPSRDLFSTPIPIQGFNSPAQPPSDEFTEHNFSFDYGDVHFVTFDSNLVDMRDAEAREARLDRLLDYVVADLSASAASWKIVYAHHPFFGTEKRQRPDDVYFQQMVSRLSEADVDLVMLAHSHTFSWTYPIIGATDSNEDGQIDFDEVQYERHADHVYSKGSGLIQLVSGAGGGSLRCPAYGEPVFATAFVVQGGTCGENPDAGHLEYGFAKVDVNPRELIVSYISAANGNIVGDTNGNGFADPHEEFFGQFRIVDSSSPAGDINRDGRLDIADIDRLQLAIREEEEASQFDLNRDNQIDRSDVSVLLDNYLGIGIGDVNLDRRVNSRDLVLVFQAGEYEDLVPGNSTWATGDWNGDGEFTSGDLVLMLQVGSFSPLASSPLASSLLASSPLASSPLASSPLASLAVRRLSDERDDSTNAHEQSLTLL